MSSKSITLVAMSLIALATGCGDSTFGGGGKHVDAADGASGSGSKAGNVSTTASAGESTVGSHDGLAGASAALSDDDKAIATCLTKWGSQNPFGSGRPAYRKVAAAITILGSGVAVNDTTPTSAPELVLITAAVSALGKPKYELLNPNGWYCIEVAVDVLSTSVVDLQCQAHLADNKVSVNVGSSSSSTAAGVGVAVLSDVTVNRTSCGG